MPVTVRPADHPPRVWTSKAAAPTAESLLKLSCPQEYQRCSNIIQSSFTDLSQKQVFSARNGFVNAAVAAYNQHHHLSIRPEDIWFAILTQLSFYINANAEELRSFFVAHEGQKELTVVDMENIADFGKMAVWMTQEMQKNIVDPDLLEWVMPDFTTTKNTDKVAAAVLFMGSMQKYFSYVMASICGIPSVTLLGEREDWSKIRARLDKLPQLGPEAGEFASLLIPVLEYFIRSFDDPADPDVITFWGRIVHKTNLCGLYYITGWIAAFCFWDIKGKKLYYPRPEEPDDPFDIDVGGFHAPRGNLNLPVFHTVNMNSIPDGFASVPVTVDNNGETIETRMVAGSVGIIATSSGEFLDESASWIHRRSSFDDNGEPITVPIRTEVKQTTGLDSLQPLTGWWMYKLTDKSNSGQGKSQAVPEDSRLTTRTATGVDSKDKMISQETITSKDVSAKDEYWWL